MEKNYKIMVMGSYNKSISEIMQSFRRIEVAYYLKDETVDDEHEFEQYWTRNGAKRAELTEEYLNQVDLVFVCGYTKIIKSELLDKYIFVNIHAGNLPKWRGTSANSWAIINGDYNIAYTLHRVTNELDGGPIYKKFEYLLRTEEKYGDGRRKLEEALAQELEDTFYGICDGTLKAIKQEGAYSYCSSFRKTDGMINDWDIPTQTIIGLFKVFGAPYGSGLFFEHKGNRYEVLELSEDRKYTDYYCTCGSVVNSDGSSVWIKTKDNVVRVGKIRLEDGEEIPAAQKIRIGYRLG